MIIYKCIITGREMFSDIYKIKESANGILLEVEGKIITRREGIDDSLIGGNASSQEQTECTEEFSQSGVDIVLNHELQETTFNKKSYLSYMSDYAKAMKAKLMETNPDRVEAFQNDVKAEVKKILGKFKDLKFYTADYLNPDCTVGLLDYREDGTPYMIFFQDGLELEKC